MLIQHPIDPPTHPDDWNPEHEGSRRYFVYQISDDRTHYVFMGEAETQQDYIEAMWQVMEKYGASGRCSDNVSPIFDLWWYPGEKCSVDGLPYPPTDPPPYEGVSLVRDED